MATASVRNPRKTWTCRDYARLDDKKRYEIIDGTPLAFDDFAAATHAEFLSKREEVDR